ncbi:phage/plasmid replication protein, gene II/X family [Pseudomonas luteola]|uniref:Phage/plasmid replication protein, gene II/X family n=1 Tax=Pseudomonas luteola TaxID=47886 RepID=A0A2X2DHC7_PSELU|nr:phage/plasmid replication protein, II/X family [Pseudomonas luteola]SPZ16883.1 phage/plasmid replication protein, gene II/X family [Pseudomonas luteola]SPZ16886.1 phage/plasmid replication protein, gene II/X family [Pseudomonas luteola]SPZ16897.1 phage/plasmid replication protein, gene II/X family [Pseudomonas luteola]
MIDYVAGFIAINHVPLSSGMVVVIEPDGSITRETPRRLVVRGTHEASLCVRSTGGDGKGNATHLYIDGNPSKWLQGHNIVGSDDIVALVADTFARLCSLLSLEPTDFERQAVKQGKWRVTRVDYNEMFELPSRADVRAWLRAGEIKCKSRHGRPRLDKGTLYFGKNSTHWAFKFYCKADEVNKGKSHNLPDEVNCLPEVHAWLENKLRAELTLRGKKLKTLTDEQGNTLETAAYLTPTVIRALFRQYLGELDMSEQLELSSEQLMELPNKLRGTYLLWKEGHNIDDVISRTTFWRHRSELMKYGIDISVRADKRPESNVVPMIRVLEAKPAAIPAFFFEKNLVHFSARKSA